jgi:cytochrome b6-f complex iron-sulfur subunit
MDRRYFLQQSCGFCLTMLVGGWLAQELSACSAGKILQARLVDREVEVDKTLLNDEHFQVVAASGVRYRIAVRRLADGQYLALLLMCTHARNPVTLTGNSFYCPLHGSRFDSQGNVTQGPAQQPLLHLPVRQDTQGNLHIALQSWMLES